MAEFTAVGDAIHNDFFVVTGSGFADDLRLLFETAAGPVTVVPDVVRPQLALVAQLPASVPTGRHWLRLQQGGTTTERIPVEVTARPPYTVRVLYSGQPKPSPYTIVFVANPAIESRAGGTFKVDPVLTNRAGYHSAVAYCLRNILKETEDLLRAGGIDAQMRFVSVFDAPLGAQSENALAHELSGDNTMEPRLDFLAPFLTRFHEVADMVFVLHGSTTHRRARAGFTRDDNSRPGVAFTYDGVAHRHRRFPSIPGSCAISVTEDTTSITALHEFCHAVSDVSNGIVYDLYHDDPAAGFFTVNKKARAQPTDPVPANFATYSGTNYNSDSNRDALGYEATWTSYHPELIDAMRPNVMDYYYGSATQLLCRLDRLTYDFLRDRLLAKLGR